MRELVVRHKQGLQKYFVRTRGYHRNGEWLLGAEDRGNGWWCYQVCHDDINAEKSCRYFSQHYLEYDWRLVDIP